MHAAIALMFMNISLAKNVHGIRKSYKILNVSIECIAESNSHNRNPYMLTNMDIFFRV